MKVGSIVTPIKTLKLKSGFDFIRINTLPEMGKHYTVKRFSVCKRLGCTILFLEEIVMGYNVVSGDEMGAEPKWFTEIEFPPALQLEIQESLTKELV